MKEFFPFPLARRGRKWTPILALGLAVIVSAPSFASQCARGQFFWKSKKKCIAKEEAAKLGIYHGRVPKADATKDSKSKDKPAEAVKVQPPPEPTAAAIASPAQAEAPAVQPAAAPPAQPAAVPPAALAPPPSPYGELAVDEFPKAK